MKTLWNAIAVMSVAHVGALLAFVGFLAGTDRLNRARIEEIRSILAPTIAEAAAADEAAAAEAAQRAEVERRLASLDEPAVGVEARNVALGTTEALVRERLMRAEQDLQNLQRFLDQRMREIETARRRFEEERDAFFAERQRLIDLQGDEQFRKMVDILKGLPAADVKAKLDVYLSEGKIDFVVDILDALDKRTAQNLLKEYQGDAENAVAADLLERLKDRGFASAAP